MEGITKDPMELWSENKKLAYYLIYRFRKTYREWPYCDKDDLEQAGLTGLWAAALSYRDVPDNETGPVASFGTYAGKVIWRRLQETIFASYPLGTAFGRALLHREWDGGCEGIDNLAGAPDGGTRTSENNETVDSLMSSCVTRLEREILLSFYWDDATLKEIGARYDKTGAWANQIRNRAVRKMARSMGLVPPDKVSSRKTWSKKKIATLLCDLGAGVSTNDAARRYGVSASMIYTIVRKAKKGIVDGSN